MVASWSVQSIKSEYAYLQTLPVVLTTDLIPIVRAIFKPIVTVYYYGNNKIPKLIKEIYSDETAYPDSPQDKLSALAKEAMDGYLAAVAEAFEAGVMPRCHLEDITRADFYGFVVPFETQYAMKLESSEPIVVQYGRLDVQQSNMAYMALMAQGE